MTLGPKQLQVLRLLHAHRLMDVQQIKALAFEESSARACQLSLTALYRDGLTARFELHRGGFGGGRSGYLYALSRKGAELIAQKSGVPPEKVVYHENPESLRAYFANHQLTVNRCLLAIWNATRRSGRYTLERWNSDPHVRMRYPVGRGWRVVHPDAIAQIKGPDGDHWFFFEIDKGTARIRRYELKILRYARFFLSGAWRGEFPVFPEIRITTTHRSRVPQLRKAVEEGLMSFPRREDYALVRRLYVAVAWEKAFLADALARIWEPAFSPDGRQEPLLRPGNTPEQVR